MGNHNSHSTGARPSLNQQQQLHQQWAHSFPRDLQRVPHLKVLPEDGLGQRLRSTDNGAMLTAEGTIRGRRNSFRRDLDDPHENGGIFRTRSIHEAHHDFGDFQRSHTQMYRDREGNHFAMQAKRFGSEPDLRIPTNNTHSVANNEGFGAKNRISRGRKKYKAPAPPLMGSTGEGSSPDSYHWELASGGDTSDSAAPQRKLRLFKTRAETHRHSIQLNTRSNDFKEDVREKSHLPVVRTNGHNSNDVIFDSRKSHIRSRNSLDLEKRDERYTRSSERYEDKGEGGVLIRGREREVEVRASHRKSAPPVMHRSLSSPEFQAELRAVTQKLRVIDRTKFEPVESKPLEKITEVNTTNRNLKEVKSRRKPDVKQSKTRDAKESKMITMDHHNILAKQRLIKGFKENIEKKQTNDENLKEERSHSKFNRTASQESETTEGNVSRGQPSGKESTPEQSPSRKNEIRKTSEEFKTPAKTFYFGMDTVDSIAPPEPKKVSNGPEKIPAYILDKPSEVPIISSYKIHRQSSSESALSSEPDLDEAQSNTHDISMHLRPTLPKKQLDIPRFSPATAWRLLSIVDTTNQSSNSNENDEVPVLIEERIERLSRPTPNIPLLGQRSSHDKSGDSGISGDAGPALMEDISDPPLPSIPHSKNQHSPPITRPPMVAWTPQQDLEEEASSSDGGLEILKEAPTDVKFNARNHVFSLSLPRESHLAQYAESDNARPSQGFNSLQKLRRSLGAALSNKTRTSDSPPDVDDNWFLSTSAPNSLNHNSLMYRLSRTHSEEEEKHMTLDKEPTMLKSPSFTYLANGGHVMYLPTIEQDKSETSKNNSRDHDDILSKVELRSKNKYTENSKFRNDRGQSIEIPCRKEFGMALKRLPISKSCENISNEMKQINRTPSPTRKQTSHVLEMIEKKANKAGKMKRFTFQSTVRQIERKRIAERLSKEAERKERQRKSELEAMRRVEEEFQKKRAREKASIRQQLRLYSLDENNKNHSSNWEQSQLRSDPDGAVSSSPAPSPTNHSQKLYAKSKDTKTPYINKLVEQKMSKTQRERERNNNIENMSRSSKRYDNYDSSHKPSPEVSKRIMKSDHRSSPIARGSDDGRIKTEVLSEYRQPTREYREYRGLTRTPNNLENQMDHQTTVHPQVVYNMPKASQGKSYHEVEGSVSPHSDNYRRNFAHGAVPTSSDSELSQPNTRSHSPRHLPRLRARSASPELQTETSPNRITTATALNDEYDLENTQSSTIIENIEQVDNNEQQVDNKNNNNNDVFINQNVVPETLAHFNPQPFVAGKCFKPVAFKAK